MTWMKLGMQWFFLGKQTCKDKIGIPLFQNLPLLCCQDVMSWETRPRVYLYSMYGLGACCSGSILHKLNTHGLQLSLGLPRWGMSSDQLPHMTCSKSHICVEVIQNTARFQWPFSTWSKQPVIVLNAVLSFICPVSRMCFATAE